MYISNKHKTLELGFYKTPDYRKLGILLKIDKFNTFTSYRLIIGLLICEIMLDVRR